MAGSWFYASQGQSGDVLFNGDPNLLSPGWVYVGPAPDPTVNPVQISAQPVSALVAQQAAQQFQAPPPPTQTTVTVPQTTQVLSNPPNILLPIIPQTNINADTAAVLPRMESGANFSVGGYIPQTTGDCQPGYIWDPTSQWCIFPASVVPDQIDNELEGGTEVESGYNVGDGTVSVNTSVNTNLQNQINITLGTLDTLANAVQAGITNSTAAAAQIEQDTANTVAYQMEGITNDIDTQATSILGAIGNFFPYLANGVASTLGTILGNIASGIGNIAKQVGDAVSGEVGPLINTINSITSEVNQIYSQYIQPILNFAQTTLQTIASLTTAIERDLHSGLAGILQIPGDINGAMTSLDASLQRTVEQIGTLNTQTVQTTLGGTADDTIWTRLQSLGTNLTSITGYNNLNTTFSQNVKLPEPNIVQAGAASVDAMWSEIMTVISALFSGGNGTLDALKTGLPVISTILGLTGEFPAMIVAVAGATFAAAIPFFKFVENDMQAKTGLSKLDPGDALRAWVRGFIDNPTLVDELAVVGWDAQRIQVMTDLQNYLIDNKDAIDMWFRGIIQDADLTANAHAHGISDVDLKALQGAAYQLYPVELATMSLRWGILTNDQWVSVLQENRYTDNQIADLQATLYTPESSDNVINRLRLTNLYTGLQFTDPAFGSVPDDLANAVKREGGDAQVALDKWQASYYVPQIQEYIELYWRGIRTQKELFAVMDYYAVPIQLRQDLIDARAPLIPFRTIPTMLANGVIEEPYAKQQLQAHGFDQTAVQALISYAALTKAKKATAPSGSLQAQSVGAAKLLWDQGALTDDQYTSVLEAHGYDATTAALVVKTETLMLQAKERKQIGQDIIDEVLAGLITLDDAQTQMTNQNFSTAERARVLKSIARVQRTTSKTPAEAELRKFVEQGAIALSDYQSALGILGYSQKWIDAYVKTYFSSLSGPATATATS